MNKGILRVLGFCCGALALVGVRLAAEELWLEERTTEIDLLGQLDVLVILEVEEGDVKVIGEDRSTVEVTIDRFDKRKEDRNRARVDVDLESGMLRVRSAFRELRDSDVLLRVPRSVSLRVQTRDGDIEVFWVSGEIDVSSVDGDVSLQEVSGGVLVNAVDGDIRIELSDTKLVNPVSLATVDGDVVLVAPRGLSATFSVSSIDGTFESEIPYSNESGKSGFGGFGRWIGVSVEGRFGDKDGPSIALKTIDGDVTVKAKD